MNRPTVQSSARVASARRLAGSGAATAELNRLAELTARLLRSESAQVSLISDVQHVMGGAGTAAEYAGTSGPSEDSLCTVTVQHEAPLVVADAASDDRVAALRPVTSGAVGSYLGVPLTASDGNVVGALCAFDRSRRDWGEQDVALLERLAEPVVAELELTALSAEYESGRVVWQLAVDSAGIGAFDWNLTTGELRWDERLLDLFGIDRDAFAGTIDAFYTVVHPEDRSRVMHALETAIASCGEYTAEYRVLLPSGDVRWVAARGRALPGPDGTAVRLLGAAYDTTAEQDAEAKVARIVEAMPTAFFQLDSAWRFSYVNGEAERVLGRPRDELVGESIWDLFPASVGSGFETSYRQAAATGEPVAFDAYYPEPLNAWYEVRAWPTPDGLSVYFVDVTARQKAQEQVQDVARRSALLARVTSELSRTLDIEEALQRLAPLVVPALGDWCVTTLVDAEASDWRVALRDVGWWHSDPEMRAAVDRYARVRIPALRESSFLHRALAADEPIVMRHHAAESISTVLEPGEARDLARRLDAESVAVVRLLGRDRTVGLLTVFRGPDREPFSAADVDTVVEVAARAGLALDNARLYAEQRDLAAELQRSMLTPPPDPDDLQVVVRYEPAAQSAQVGGDWYDAFVQDTGVTVVVVGDVVGHDTAAAAAMGQVRSLLRGIAAHSSAGPAEVLRGVDRVMRTLEVDTTATAVVVGLERSPDDGSMLLRWSNAGHPPPLVVSPDGCVDFLTGTGHDLLLGLEPATERHEGEVALEPGATVLIYTDGLVERRGETLDTGMDRLRATIAELTAGSLGLQQMCDVLLERLLPERPDDDVALVAVRLRDVPEPRPS